MKEKGKLIMKRKLLKGISVGSSVFGVMLLFGTNVNAYIDPSVMTYLIQAVAAIVIAVGAVIGMYWRKGKKKIAEKLNIDENANKEIETDDIIIKNDR